MEITDIYRIFLKSTGISIDSRSSTQGQLYFALKGTTFDGNVFAEEVLSKGAVAAVTDNISNKDINGCIYVSDSLEALQKLAKLHREKLNIPVIGITGSNGKTTTKELLYTVLSEYGNIHATKGNLNNHIGVPLTLLAMRPEHKLAIVEMGANHFGEIADLCNIAQPDYGIITNIGKAHLEGFKTEDNIIATKKALYESLLKRNGIAFVNSDDALLMELSKDLNRKLYGSKGPDLIYETNSDTAQVGILVNDNGNLSSIVSQLFGRYNGANIAAAYLTGLEFGISPDKISKAIGRYIPSNNRSQLLQTGNNILLIDCYNANPSSMEVALKSLENYPSGKKVAILGEMYELGEKSKEEHQRIALIANNMGFDRVIFIGNWSNEDSFISTAECQAYLEKEKIHGAVVLLKGSRGVKLEALIENL
jgi:UDP-N-acetylmuramoyl-tripeptide--D-alanyl-D-alanine ligase